jgi:hypothetical protein
VATPEAPHLYHQMHRFPQTRQVSEVTPIAALDLMSAVTARWTGISCRSQPKSDHDRGDANVYLIQCELWRKEEQTTSTTSTHVCLTSTPGPILAASISNA